MSGSRERSNRQRNAPVNPDLRVEITEKEITSPLPTDAQLDSGALPDENGLLPSQRRSRYQQLRGPFIGAPATRIVRVTKRQPPSS